MYQLKVLTDAVNAVTIEFNADGNGAVTVTETPVGGGAPIVSNVDAFPANGVGFAEWVKVLPGKLNAFLSAYKASHPTTAAEFEAYAQAHISVDASGNVIEQ